MELGLTPAKVVLTVAAIAVSAALAWRRRKKGIERDIRLGRIRVVGGEVVRYP